VVRTVGLEPTIPRSQSECPATGLRPGGAGAPGGGDGTRTRSRLHAKQLHHRCASPPGGPARGVCRARNLFGCPAAGQATWDRPVDAGPRSRPGSCAWHAALPRWRGLSTVERKERGSNPQPGFEPGAAAVRLALPSPGRPGRSHSCASRRRTPARTRTGNLPGLSRTPLPVGPQGPGALARTRTGTLAWSTSTSSSRVYQFRHEGNADPSTAARCACWVLEPPAGLEPATSDVPGRCSAR
jgi:hypothetical protein